MVRAARALETKEFQFRKTIAKTSLATDTNFINLDQLWDRVKDLHIHKIEVECLEYEDPDFENRLGTKGFMYTDLEIDGHTDQRRIATETIDPSWLVQDPSEIVPNLHSFDSFFLRRDQKLEIALRYERVIDDISDSFKVYGTVKIWYSDDSVPEYENKRISRLRKFEQINTNTSGETTGFYHIYELEREAKLILPNGRNESENVVRLIIEENEHRNVVIYTEHRLASLQNGFKPLMVHGDVVIGFFSVVDGDGYESNITIKPECW